MLPWFRSRANFHASSLVTMLSVFPFQLVLAQPLTLSDRTLETVSLRPIVLVSKPSDQDYQRVDMVTIDANTQKPISREPTSLGCTRVHVASNGMVHCYTKVIPGKPKYYANPTSYVFGKDFKQQTQLRSSRGIISRARISADGKYTASTAFTTGHSYLGVGGSQFSTATLIGRTNDRQSEENIQQWTVSYKGDPVTATDLNLWGVTFDPKNSDRFFVTTYFNGKPYLAEGSVAAKKMVVVREAMECPSFSPDGSKLAFKKRTSATGWSPAIYDIATKTETVFAVPDSVDDQIEWLDAHTLIYEVTDTPLVGKPKVNLMTLDTKAAKPTQTLWLEDARSPTILR